MTDRPDTEPRTERLRRLAATPMSKWRTADVEWMPRPAGIYGADAEVDDREFAAWLADWTEAEAAQGGAPLDTERLALDLRSEFGEMLSPREHDVILAIVRANTEGAAPLDMSCDRIVNNGMGEPTECGRPYPCDVHDEGAAPLDHDCVMPSACGVTGFYCSNWRAASRAEGLDVERLRQHEPEPGLGLAGTSWRWDCSCGWYIEDGDAQRWWTHVLSAARLAPQERRE